VTHSGFFLADFVESIFSFEKLSELLTTGPSPLLATHPISSSAPSHAWSLSPCNIPQGFFPPAFEFLCEICVRRCLFPQGERAVGFAFNSDLRCASVGPCREEVPTTVTYSRRPETVEDLGPESVFSMIFPSKSPPLLLFEDSFPLSPVRVQLPYSSLEI